MHHIRPRFLTLVFTASLLLWASIVGTLATAAPIPVPFAYTGTVTDISFGLLDDASPFGSSPYVPGSFLLTGVYTFNSSTPNPSLDPTVRFYENTLLSHTVQLRDSSNAVIDDSPLSTPPSNFIQIATGVLDLFQQTISDYYSVAFQFYFSFFNQNSASGGGVVTGTITSITPVPLAPAVILGAGLVALIGLGAGLVLALLLES